MSRALFIALALLTGPALGVGRAAAANDGPHTNQRDVMFLAEQQDRAVVQLDTLVIGQGDVS